MTREEAIEIFLNRGWIKVEGGTYFDGDKWREAIMVISDYFRNEYKALEQEPILDKIRAEIEDLAYEERVGYVVVDLDDVFRIIDKYKAESEVI